MNLLQFIKNRGLNFKLNTVLLVSFGVLAAVLIVTTNANFSSLLLEFSQEELEQETRTLQQHFADREREILNNARLLAAAPRLVEAIESGDVSGLRASFVVQRASLGLDNVDVINAERQYLLTISEADTRFDPESEENLLQLGLIGAQTVRFLSEEGTDKLILAAVVPVKNAAGAVVGVVITGRKIDEAFMDALDFESQERHISLIYNEKVVATDSSKPEEFADVTKDQSLINRALRGESLIPDTLTENTDGILGMTAYMPAVVSGEIQGVFVLRLEVEPLQAFQRRLTTTTLLVVVVVPLLALAAAILFIRQVVIRPLARLKTSSEQFASGDMNQRVAIHAKDELGQLSQSFNTMADQINDLIAKLEQRVNEAQRAREQAERSDQVKSAFLASMSHELRTPLNAVINFTRFVMDGDMGPVNAEQVEALGEVTTSARHLLNLINDVLDMSKIESGALNLFVEDNLNLNEILNSVATTGKSFLVNKPVELRAEFEDNLPAIRGDRQRIVQILLNVVSNACKFTEEGHVKIKASSTNSEIIISITDTGPGIAPEDQGDVFEAFKQTASGLRRGGGTGLGMPISRSLVEAHGGRLWLESEVGKGTTFYVALPIKSDKLTPALVA